MLRPKRVRNGEALSCVNMYVSLSMYICIYIYAYILYYIILHYTTLHYTILYYTILYDS